MELEQNERWKIEAKHQDRKVTKKTVQDFDPLLFYRNRPYGLKCLLDEIGPVKSLRILDVGCGLGSFTYYFLGLGAEVYSLDISFDALNNLQKRRQLHKISSPVEHLPLKSQSIDIIWCAAALHHLEIRPAVKELHRVLRDGGRCYFYEPLGYNPFVNLYRLLTPGLRTPTEHPLNFDDLKMLQDTFHSVDTQFYHLMALIPQAVGSFSGLFGMHGNTVYRKLQPLETTLAKIDKLCFRLLPASRRWAEVVAVTCYKS